MRKVTKNTLIVVIISSLICIVGFLVMTGYITRITRQYSAVMDEQLVGQQLMAKISNRMYYMHSLTSDYVTSSEQGKTTEYTDKLTECQDDIEGYFNLLNEIFVVHDDLELIHSLDRSYKEFSEQAEIIVNLCKSGQQYSAEYYVSEVMLGYLYEADSNLRLAEQHMEDKIETVGHQMKVSVSNMKMVRIFCIVIMITCVALCIHITFRNGQKILDTQDEQRRAHNERIMDMQYKTIIGMANLIESRDGDTGKHVKRTSMYVKMLAESLVSNGYYTDILTPEYIDNLCKASPMHDIGKIHIPDKILQKPGKLTDEEFEIIKGHTVEGGKAIYAALGEIEEKEYLEMAYNVAMYHHEKWDGNGYPEHRSGADIPLCARIMAVADVFDALLSKRCYKEAFPFRKSCEIIEESSGTHFDPAIVDVFMKIKDEIQAYVEQEEQYA